MGVIIKKMKVNAEQLSHGLTVKEWIEILQKRNLDLTVVLGVKGYEDGGGYWSHVEEIYEEDNCLILVDAGI